MQAPLIQLSVLVRYGRLLEKFRPNLVQDSYVSLHQASHGAWWLIWLFRFNFLSTSNGLSQPIMLLIRRLWILPALVITGILYLFFQRASRFSADLPIADDRIQSEWVKRPERHPVGSYIPLPSGPAKSIPKIQHAFPTESDEEKKIRLNRLEAVKESFVHSWQGYKKYAYGFDEKPPPILHNPVLLRLLWSQRFKSSPLLHKPVLLRLL